MYTTLSDTERERLVERILRAAAAVVEGAGWEDAEEEDWFLAQVEELADALADLPLAERERYGV